MHVLVIGGGIAGLATAADLRKKAGPDLRITLVEPKAYVEVPWAAIRALFDAPMRERTIFPLPAWAAKHNVNHVQATATALSTSKATLSSGETIDFDFCIIAVGAHAPAPELARPAKEVDLDARRAQMQQDAKRLMGAGSVLVVGGGAIGAELAGDLAAYAGKAGKKLNVTLVHSAEHLVPEFKPAAAAKLQKQLERCGVRVVLEDRAEEKDGKWTLRSSGEVIEAQEVFVCTGVSPCNEFMTAGDLGASLDEKGWIKVDDQFRVDGGQGKLFAFGDCCNMLEKTGVAAMTQKAVVVNNVVISMTASGDGKDMAEVEPKMKSKASLPPIFIVTGGPDAGVASFPFGSITFLLPGLKNKSMFIPKAKGELGL